VAWPALRREAAQVAGTAVHRVLEELELTGDVRAGLERGAERLEGLLPDTLAGDDRDAALARGRELLARIAAGGLCDRLVGLAGQVVARELPVLLPPGEGDAVGFVAGAVDLLYRDPETGELVVADYKTDRVESEAEVAEKVRDYGGQGRVYVEAVQRALGLSQPPRFELWFLHAGRIETA
jgi:ATP-dependent exoDNAse (exonuclease V) beta subunit